MDLGRRQVLAGLGFGLAALTFPRLPLARQTIMPGGGIDQTTMLQHAADQAARTGVPLRLPAGTYSTGALTLNSGTQIEGVPGQTILRSRGRGSIITMQSIETVRLSGLVLDGDNQPLGMDGALLVADDVSGLDISACHVSGSGGNGVALHCVSGRIALCTMRRIGGTALSSVECRDLAILNNRIEHAATGLLLSGAPDDGSVVVRGNVIKGMFLRKTLPHSGVGIVADGRAVIRGNSIDGAPAYGILISDPRRARIAGNTIRNAYIDVASAPAAEAIAC